MKYKIGQKLIAKYYNDEEFIIKITSHDGGAGISWYQYKIVDEQNASYVRDGQFAEDSAFDNMIQLLHESPTPPIDMGRLARDADSVATDLYALSGRRKTIMVRDSDRIKNLKLTESLIKELGLDCKIVDYGNSFEISKCCYVTVIFPLVKIEVYSREHLDQIADFASRQIDDPFEYEIINCSKV